ncbi:MAG TPA: response regulator [Pirellulaceae bacterium]|nr:response regulator [Planctomycetales bacterium]MCB9936835.1 response regulator [Planctomycetaceae bacterium]HRX77515.1 response regulator [Pirellulaceae bacterium]
MFLDMPSMLITDDDRAFRETLGGLFEQRGFHTMLAEDGQEAFEIVQREKIHVVLLDMNMPRLTGLETIRRVKRVHASVPCILLSAEMDETLAEEARQACAFSTHAKPISLPEITQTVSLAMRITYDWPAA